MLTVSVPATSANLGPGFDSFGLALDLHNRFSATLADEWRVDVAGEGAGILSTGEDNVVARSMARAFLEAGQPGSAAYVRCENRIPTGSGLGSSSAAIVGGLMLGEALLGIDFGDVRRLELAAELEGHPDNVAAALNGGFTICWAEMSQARCARFEPARGLAAVVCSALTELRTSVARAMLPDAVPHADAAFNVAHAGLLAASLATGRPELFGAALTDRLHEPYRAAAVADLDPVADALRDAGAAGVALSGAGPTVIGLVSGETDADALDAARSIAERAADAVARLGTRRAPQALAIDRRGARIE